ncbi:MAG: hypothetical protein A2V98_08355 [Planctomycetes bacterium RBG_16_64_12]|nr:MAG: hypothetical protein A2V98_08355 [Planctomycetes bacterium RBG_16_64_12]
MDTPIDRAGLVAVLLLLRLVDSDPPKSKFGFQACDDLFCGTRSFCREHKVIDDTRVTNAELSHA